MSFSDMSIRISKMNDTTRSLYTQGKGTTITQMKEAIAKQSRETLDQSFGRIGDDASIKGLRGELRDLVTLEESIVPMYRRELRKNGGLSKTARDSLGSVGTADILSGIASGSTSTATRGGVLLGQKIISEIFGTPEARLRRAVKESTPKSPTRRAIGIGLGALGTGIKFGAKSEIIQDPEKR